MIATTEAFAMHVAGHAGLDEDRAAEVVRVVLAGLGTYLTEPARSLVAEELPESLRHALDGGGQPFAASSPQVRELVASVCRVLSEELSDEALAAMRAQVPPDLGEMLERGEFSEVVAVAPPPERTETLSEGRPGSHHPISESQGARAQTGSVADGNPHAAVKVSSSPGTTQERQHDTIAEGVPGSTHPVGRSRS